MYLAAKNEVQATSEKPEKKQNEDDVVIPRQTRKWVMRGKGAGNALRDSGINDRAKLDDADHRSEQKQKNAADALHFSKCACI
jgi:hypothetical protein